VYGHGSASSGFIGFCHQMGETAHANHPFQPMGLRTELKLPISPAKGEIANSHCAASPAATQHGFRQNPAHILDMEL
jgi:hypothetical protein